MRLTWYSNLLIHVFLDALHIGDYIVLKEAKIECFMSAEGILSNDLYVDNRTSTIGDSLFCIHLQVLFHNQFYIL